jgi:hypothetical protein
MSKVKERKRKSTTKLSTKVTTGSKRDQRNRSEELKTEGRGQGVEDELDGNMESLGRSRPREEIQRTAERERLETN